MDDQKCLLIFVVIACFCVKYNVAQRGSLCQTPNGETATCVSIYDCTRFLTAVQAKVPSQLSFIKKSQCGWDSQPLVCCGIDVDFTNKPQTQPISPVGRRTFTNTNNNFRRNSLIPDRTRCGFQESDNGIGGFIFGGSATQIDEFPWLALLGYTSKFGERKWACGGTLINERYVLTAAHCVAGDVLEKVGNPAVVKLGEHNTDTNRDCDSKNTKCSPAPIVANIEEIKYHPNYDLSSNSPNDIALIRLNQNVAYTNYIRPICLPEPNEASQDGENVTTAGWGKIENGKPSPIKLKVEIPFVNHQKCNRVYLANGITLLDSQICAGGEGGKDSCSGDSGGPLMKRSNNNTLQWYQEGVVSFGSIKCGIRGLPGVYTRITDFLQWIHNTVRS